MSRRTRLLLSSLFLLAVFVGVPVLLTWRAARQAKLNQALIAAVRQNDVRAVRQLLLQGASPHAQELRRRQNNPWQQLLTLLGYRVDEPPATALGIAKEHQAFLEHILLHPVDGYDQPEMLHCMKIVDLLEQASVKE